MTPRMLVIGGMAAAATLLLAVAFVAAATGSPAPETARSSLPEFDANPLARPAPAPADAQPASAPSPSSTAGTEPRSTGAVPTVPAPQRPRPARVTPSGPPAPKCQGKLIKKC
jgi:hypothetical protein